MVYGRMRYTIYVMVDRISHVAARAEVLSSPSKPLYPRAWLCVAHAPERYDSRKVFFKSFCRSQFPHKFVNLFFILGIVKYQSTVLWGS